MGGRPYPPSHLDRDGHRRRAAHLRAPEGLLPRLGPGIDRRAIHPADRRFVGVELSDLRYLPHGAARPPSRGMVDRRGSQTHGPLYPGGLGRPGSRGWRRSRSGHLPAIAGDIRQPPGGRMPVSRWDRQRWRTPLPDPRIRLARGAADHGTARHVNRSRPPCRHLRGSRRLAAVGRVRDG